MPRTKGAKNLNLPRTLQREIILDDLRGGSPTRIVHEYGVSERTVFRLRTEALKDPEGAVEEAREELAFREEVAELAGF